MNVHAMQNACRTLEVTKTKKNLFLCHESQHSKLTLQLPSLVGDLRSWCIDCLDRIRQRNLDIQDNQNNLAVPPQSTRGAMLVLL
jgi:hypothetical protein